MDTKLKIELFARQYNATMTQSEEVLNEYESDGMTKCE